MADRDYQRGYAAGRAKRVCDDERARFDRFYAAAMTGLLATASRWGRGQGADRKDDSTPEAYAETARDIAKAMVKVVP